MSDTSAWTSPFVFGLREVRVSGAVAVSMHTRKTASACSPACAKPTTQEPHLVAAAPADLAWLRGSTTEAGAASRRGGAEFVLGQRRATTNTHSIVALRDDDIDSEL